MSVRQGLNRSLPYFQNRKVRNFIFACAYEGEYGISKFYVWVASFSNLKGVTHVISRGKYMDMLCYTVQMNTTNKCYVYREIGCEGRERKTSPNILIYSMLHSPYQELPERLVRWEGRPPVPSLGDVPAAPVISDVNLGCPEFRNG